MEQQTKSTNNDFNKIDLIEIFFLLLEKAWLIILSAITGAVIFAWYTVYTFVPMYQSTGVLYVISSSTTIVSVSDLNLGSILIADYKKLALSRPTLEQVIEGIDLDTSYQELRKCISITNPTDTHMLDVTVTYTDPENARDIANELLTVLIRRVPEAMAADPPRIVESAITPKGSSMPDVVGSALKGAMLFGAAVCAIVILIDMLNDTIRSEEDMTRYLGITTLASLPIDEERNKQERKTKKRRHSKRKKKAERKSGV